MKKVLASLLLVLPVLAASAGGKSVELARQELKTHLRLAVGSGAPEGWTFKFERPAGASEAAEFESLYRIDGKTVWFWGDDRGAGRQQRWGTLFAVELFAEKELGIVWMWPGEDGTVCRRRKRLELKGPRTETFRPPLEKSEFRNYSKAKTFRQWEGFAPKALRTITEEGCAQGYADRDIWLKRHRLQDRMRAGYGHAFTDWRVRFLKTHPEYLNLHARTGERGWVGTAPAAFVKLCTANEDVVDQIVADWCARGTNAYLNVCENDGSFYCECDRCRAKDADLPGETPNRDHLADRYVDFWNRIARKATAIRPDVTLIAYAYSDYRFAPRRTRILYPDNMLFGFVPSIMDDCEAEFAKWRDMGMRHFFLRPNFHCYWGTIPRGLERWLYDNFHTCLRLGMIGVDYDSNLGRYPMHLESYVTARMIADPKGRFEDFCNDFYRAYGAAAPAVKRYYEAVRADGERSLALLDARRTNGNLLDDSQLSLQTAGRTEEGLTAQLTMLREALKDPALDATSRARLEDLAVRARHAVLGYRFLASASDSDRLEANGRRLLEFRKTAVKHLPDDYGALFSTHYGEEGPLWNRVGAYIGFLNGEEVPETGTMDGWRTDFEKAKLGTWGAREAFLAVTNDAASSGSWSVKLKTGASEQIGLWRHSNLLRPNASFRLSADVRLDPGVRYASLGVVLDKGKRPGEDRKWIASQRLKGPTDGFRRLSVDFRTPPEKRTVTFYFFVGPGGDGKSAWFDNAKLERLDETK